MIFQAALVLALSAFINIPRWLEFEYGPHVETVNITDTENGVQVVIGQFNQSRIVVQATDLRRSDDYIRDYTLISATVLIVILPTLIMLVR